MITARTSRQRGQNLIEYALTLPLMLLFILAVLELGRAAYTYSALQNAARAGARYGVLYTNTGDITGVQAAARQIAVGVGLDPGDINVVWNTTTPKKVQVTITYAMPALTPFVEWFLGTNSITLHARATMQLEH